MSRICAPPILNGPNRGRTATGTLAGYVRHRKIAEEACPECRVAAATAQRKSRSRNRPQPVTTGPTTRKPTYLPALKGSRSVYCKGCGARGSANRGLLKRNQYTIPNCANCREDTG